MRTALVTGGASRIGAEIARHLSKQNWKVIIHYNTSQQQAEDLAREIGGETVHADFAKSGQIQKMFSNISKMPELIINNAAIFKNDTSPLAYDEQLQINLLAPQQIIWESCWATKNEISIINMLDVWATTMPVNFESYALTKVALGLFTRNFARLLPLNARINGIALGVVLYKAGQAKDVFLELQKKFPTSIDDILKAIDYIISHKELRGEVIKLTEWKPEH